MTEPATTTYRRIGEDSEHAPDADRPGLRRIGERRRPSPAPARKEAKPVEAEAPAEEAAAAPTGERAAAGTKVAPDDDWTVPHPDELDDADADADADADGDGTTGSRAPEAAVPTAGRRKGRRPTKATATTATEDERRPAAARTSRTPLLLVSAVAVLLAAAVVVLSVLYIGQSNQDGLRSSALSAARSDGVILSSYDYRDLTGPTSDWVKVEQNSTPAFRKNFLSTSGDLGKLLTQYNAVATGKVLNAGIQSLSGNRAVILLFIDQTVNNTVQKGQGTTQPLRSLLTLVHQNGKWLIDDLQVPK